MQVFRIRKHDARVDSRGCRQHSADAKQDGPINTRPKAGIHAFVECPGDDTGGHRGVEDVHEYVVHRIQPAEGLLRPQVEYAVCAQRSRRSIVQIEEPDGAIDQSKPHRQQGVHRPHRQAVEGKLQGLVGRLADLPTDVSRGGCCEYYCQEVIQARALGNQVRSL